MSLPDSGLPADVNIENGNKFKTMSYFSRLNGIVGVQWFCVLYSMFVAIMSIIWVIGHFDQFMNCRSTMITEYMAGDNHIHAHDSPGFNWLVRPQYYEEMGVPVIHSVMGETCVKEEGLCGPQIWQKQEVCTFIDAHAHTGSTLSDYLKHDYLETMRVSNEKMENAVKLIGEAMVDDNNKMKHGPFMHCSRKHVMHVFSSLIDSRGYSVFASANSGFYFVACLLLIAIYSGIGLLSIEVRDKGGEYNNSVSRSNVSLRFKNGVQLLVACLIVVAFVSGWTQNASAAAEGSYQEDHCQGCMFLCFTVVVWALYMFWSPTTIYVNSTTDVQLLPRRDSMPPMQAAFAPGIGPVVDRNVVNMIDSTHFTSMYQKQLWMAIVYCKYNSTLFLLLFPLLCLGLTSYQIKHVTAIELQTTFAMSLAIGLLEYYRSNLTGFLVYADQFVINVNANDSVEIPIKSTFGLINIVVNVLAVTFQVILFVFGLKIGQNIFDDSAKWILNLVFWINVGLTIVQAGYIAGMKNAQTYYTTARAYFTSENAKSDTSNNDNLNDKKLNSAVLKDIGAFVSLLEGLRLVGYVTLSILLIYMLFDFKNMSDHKIDTAVNAFSHVNENTKNWLKNHLLPMWLKSRVFAVH